MIRVGRFSSYIKFLCFQGETVLYSLDLFKDFFFFLPKLTALPANSDWIPFFCRILTNRKGSGGLSVTSVTVVLLPCQLHMHYFCWFAKTELTGAVSVFETKNGIFPFVNPLQRMFRLLISVVGSPDM